MLDFRALITIWGLLTFMFTVGGVYATIRFGLKTLTEKQAELAARIDGVDVRHKSYEVATEARAEKIRIEAAKHQEDDRRYLESALKSVETTISQRLDGQEQFFRQVLFRDDGITNYLPRGECEQCRISCQTRLDNRLESIQKAIVEADAKREKSKDEITKMFTTLVSDLAKLSGSVNEHHKRRSGDEQG